VVTQASKQLQLLLPVMRLPENKYSR